MTSGQAAPTGSVIRTVVPTPATLWTRMSPPWASIAVSAIDRPSPLPPRLRVRLGSALKKRSVTRAGDLGRHAGTVIDDVDNGTVAIASQVQLDRRVARSVDERVADDVGEHLPQAILVTRHHDRPLDVGADRPARVDRRRIAGSVGHEHGEIDRPGLERPVLVELGERQHVVDEAAHPDRLLLGSSHRLVQLARLAEPPASEQLGVPTDRGDRCAQLMRRIGDELAEPVLRPRPHVEAHPRSAPASG